MSIIRKTVIILLGIVFFMSCAHNPNDSREPSGNEETKQPSRIEKRSRASDFY